MALRDLDLRFCGHCGNPIELPKLKHNEKKNNFYRRRYGYKKRILCNICTKKSRAVTLYDRNDKKFIIFNRNTFKNEGSVKMHKGYMNQIIQSATIKTKVKKVKNKYYCPFHDDWFLAYDGKTVCDLCKKKHELKIMV